MLVPTSEIAAQSVSVHLDVFRRQTTTISQILFYYHFMSRASIAWSVYPLATGWTIRGSIPVEARFPAPVQISPEIHPASYTYLLTYSMVQSPSWEANWFEASQEIPRISRNPKVHYRNHKRPPPVSILGQPNPVHIPTSHLLEIHPNIIYLSTLRFPQWSPSLRFPHQDPIPPSPHPYAPHA